MDDREIDKLQRYLHKLFGNRTLKVKRGRQKDALEVDVGGEFVGTIYRDEEEGEVSYAFTVSILDIDLDEDAA